jgi:NDP-sugar pyrophosphorylase family protein
MTVEAIVLAGGLGTRLRGTIGDHVPKPLAVVGGKPILARVLDNLARAGVEHVTLAIGHLSEAVKDYYSDWTGHVQISFSEEITPLGTGGATILALATIKSPYVLVCNGDTNISIPLDEMEKVTQTGLSGCVLLTRASDVSRFGQVLVSGSTASAFSEKSGSGEGLIYAGVALFQARRLQEIVRDIEPPYSLEECVLKYLASSGELGYVVSLDSQFIDIGTPASFAHAQELLQ